MPLLDPQAHTMPTPCATIKILLAVEHELFRTGLRNLLERERGVQIAAEALDGREAVRLATDLIPDILLIDIDSPELSAIEVLRRLAQIDSPVRTFLLASPADQEQTAEAFRLGARGVVFRNAATKTLITGLRSVMDGSLWVGDSPVAGHGGEMASFADLPETPKRPKNFGLTKRELQVINAIVSGDSNKDIAREFAITEDTVKHHLTNIFDKVGVYNRLELALFALEHGWLIERRQGNS
jgi:DNA-binding NarL/FixJ family response regulator